MVPSLWRRDHNRPALRRNNNARSHTAAITDVSRQWQWGIVEHPPYSPDMSPCDYCLIAIVKEPLRGNRYNTRDELTRAMEWSIWNVNRDGRVDGVLRLPNIWQKLINKGATILKVHKCCILVNKAMSEVSLLPLLCIQPS